MEPMTDTYKLKRLAEAALEAGDPFVTIEDVADYGAFQATATPEAILALIAERDEAVALLRDVVRHEVRDLTHNISYFLARIDAKGSE